MKTPLPKILRNRAMRLANARLRQLYPIEYAALLIAAEDELEAEAAADPSWGQERQPGKRGPEACLYCDRRPHKAYGMCGPCYDRWDRAGRPENGPPPPMTRRETGLKAAAARRRPR